MRKRRRRLRRDDAGDRRKLNRNFIENENLVKSDFDVIVELRDDVNATEAFGDVQRLVLLFFRDVALQNALDSGERAVMLRPVARSLV